ncbi:MAG: M48 family metalloprotease [candidate division FCPU426 bacterium]
MLRRFLAVGLSWSLVFNIIVGCSTVDRLVFKQQPKAEISNERLKDESAKAYASKILEKLQAYLKNKTYLSMNLLADSRVQGMANWMSEITLTRGMLNSLSNEAELACLIAHEIGHVVLKHDERRFRNDNTFGKVLKLGLDLVMKDNLLKQDLLKQQKEISEAGWGKELEKEADIFGVELARMAGYNPYAFVDFFERLSSWLDADPFYHVRKLKGTHPALDERAAYLRDYLNKKGYSRTEGVYNPQAYRAAMSGLTTYTQNTNPQQPPKQRDEEKKKQQQADQEHLRAIHSELDTLQQTGKPLSSERFIQIMQDIAVIARRYQATEDEIKRVINGYGEGPQASPFMEEVLHQEQPVWDDDKLQTRNEAMISDALEALKKIGRIGVGFVPAVGDAVDLYEFLTGTEFLTGERLTPFERIMTAFGLLVGSGTGWRNLTAGIEKQFEQETTKIIAENIGEARVALRYARDTFASSGTWTRRYARTVNNSYGRMDYKAPYWGGTSIYETVMQQDHVFMRVHGSNNQASIWLIDFDARQFPKEQLKDMLALPEVPSRVSLVKVPAGVKMRLGLVGKNADGQGGAIQWEIILEELSQNSDDRKMMLNKLGIAFKEIGELR